MSSNRIKVVIVGVGNCTSSLIQGISHYKSKQVRKSQDGLMHEKIGGYAASDIDIVCAYDIDKRKVGLNINDAIFAKPNCTKIFCEKLIPNKTIVQMGLILDGYSEHMSKHDPDLSFVLSDNQQPTKEEVIASLKNSGAEVMMNYLPVGSQKATEFYAECALEAGVAFVNNIPVFIASDPKWAKKFNDKNIPIIGDDIKAQMGATITHRTLVDLMVKRGVKINKTYQLNTGGNTDFMNMLNQERLLSKRESKTSSVTSQIPYPVPKNDVYIGPSDYVPWQKDNKVCFLRIEGELFGGVPMNLECRLSVEDSPNSAGVAIDSVRCAKLALDKKIGGVLEAPSAYFCKHPAKQFTDSIAYELMEDFVMSGDEAASNKNKILQEKAEEIY